MLFEMYIPRRNSILPSTNSTSHSFTRPSNRSKHSYIRKHYKQQCHRINANEQTNGIFPTLKMDNIWVKERREERGRGHICVIRSLSNKQCNKLSNSNFCLKSQICIHYGGWYELHITFIWTLFISRFRTKFQTWPRGSCIWIDKQTPFVP